MNRRLNELDRLLADHGAALHTLLLRLTLQADAAEELMQELFTQLAASRGFDGADDKPAYAFRVAINLAMRWRRVRHEQRSTMTLAADPVDPADSVLHKMVRSEQVHRILDTLDRLSDEAREIVVGRFLREQSYASIGRRIGKSAHQTRALCHKAIRRLRDLLNEKEASDGD